MTTAKPKYIFAKFNQILDKGDTEDCFKIVIKFDNRLVAEGEMLKAMYGKPLWHVCGTKGTILVDNTLPVIGIKIKTKDGKERIKRIDFRKDKGNTIPHYEDLAKKLMKGEKPPISPFYYKKDRGEVPGISGRILSGYGEDARKFQTPVFPHKSRKPPLYLCSKGFSQREEG